MSHAFQLVVIPAAIFAVGGSVRAHKSLEHSTGPRGKYHTVVVKDIHCQDNANKPRIFVASSWKPGPCGFFRPGVFNTWPKLLLWCHVDTGLVLHLAQAG